MRRVDHFGLRPARIGHIQNGSLPLPQDNEVSDNLGSGVLLKRARRQPERGHQLSVLGEVVADHPGLLVHRPGRGDAHDDPARAHLIQRLDEEVIMQVRRQLHVPAIGNLDVHERPVADDQIIEVVGRPTLLVTHDLHVCARIEDFRHATGQPVQFDPGEVAVLGQMRRHHAEEVADAHGRFKDAATLEAHLFGDAPHRLHGRRIRVMGVDDGVLGGLPFVSAEVGTQPIVLFAPAVPVNGPLPCALEEFLTEGTPTDVGGHGLQFFRRRIAIFLADTLKGLDGRLVLGKPLLRRSAKQGFGVADDVVGPPLRRQSSSIISSR